MMENETPFADVMLETEGFSMPELKWRELLFVGALKRDGDAYVRDPSRPLPPFGIPDLFPEDACFHATLEGPRVRLRRVRDRA